MLDMWFFLELTFSGLDMSLACSHTHPLAFLALFYIEGGCLMQQQFQGVLENGFWPDLVSDCHHGRLEIWSVTVIMEDWRKVFLSCLLPVVSPVSVTALSLLWHLLPLDRKREKNPIYKLYFDDFAYKNTNQPTLPRSDFPPTLLYKMQAVQGCYSNIAVSLGTKSFTFLLGHPLGPGVHCQGLLRVQNGGWSSAIVSVF